MSIQDLDEKFNNLDEKLSNLNEKFSKHRIFIKKNRNKKLNKPKFKN
jgi:hypothetical protein